MKTYREAAAKVGTWLEDHFDAGVNRTIEAERVALPQGALPARHGRKTRPGRAGGPEGFLEAFIWDS